MRSGLKFALGVLCAVAWFGATAAHAESGCKAKGTSLAVSRTVEIDTQHGPIFGAFTLQAKEPSFLRPKEVVLTFDDGPMPWITRSILETLEDFCTKATFFSVGRMALAYPDVVREVLAQGHTVGTHTLTHPFNMHRMNPERAHREIDQGFAAVAAAAGQPIAPFFRFTGLADSGPLLKFLATRGVATFTVDVVSNDSYIKSPKTLTERTVREIEKNNGGIVLFHDIKASTAKALPEILKQLADKGFSIVHMRAKADFVPEADATRAVLPKLAAIKPTQDGAAEKLPFYGRVHPKTDQLQAQDVAATQPPVELIVPEARERPATKVKQRSQRNSKVRSRNAKRRKAKTYRQKSAAGNTWQPFFTP